MSDETQTDRLPLLTPGELNADQKKVYDRMEAEQVPWATKAGFKPRRWTASCLARSMPCCMPRKSGKSIWITLPPKKKHAADAACP